MAIPFLNNIDLSDNQLLNAKLQVTSTAPTAAIGQIYYNSGDAVARYYNGSANPSGPWVSITDTSLTDGTFVSTTNTGGGVEKNYTVDLSATGTPDATKYLRGDNAWEPISAIPGTYNWILSGDTGGPNIIQSGTGVSIVGGQDLETTLSGTTLTVDLKVGPDPSPSADNYIMNQATVGVGSMDSLAVNHVYPGAGGVFNAVKKTTLGAIPVTALTLIKTYIDESVTGLLQFIGGFNANTGDLDSPLVTDLYTDTVLAVGDLYVVSTAGNFFGNALTPLTPGDSVIVQTAVTNPGTTPAVEADFIVVQSDTDLATLATVGIGNVNASTDSDKVGLYVSYSSGTANIGFDIDSLTQGTPSSNNTDAYIAYYDDNAAANKKITFAQLSTEINAETSFSGTIGDGALTSLPITSGTHGLGADSTSFMIQLVEVSSGETVYADVVRGASGLVTIVFAVAPALNSIRVLIQKIG